MINTVLFLNNGNYAAFQEGEQVAPEQGNAWIDILQDKLDRKVINLETEVMMPGWWTPDHPDSKWTVGELVKTAALKITK